MAEREFFLVDAGGWELAIMLGIWFLFIGGIALAAYRIKRKHMNHKMRGVELNDETGKYERF